MEPRLARLTAFFSEIKENSKIINSIVKGVLLKGSITHIATVFQRLFAEQLIKPGQSFLETGSGDGRICALANMFGLHTYGMELNVELAKQSKLYCDQLRDMNILANSLTLKIMQGNFLNIEEYKKIGKSFWDFEIIYNYTTFQNELAKMIKDYAQPETLFIFHGSTRAKKTFLGLELIKTLPLPDTYQQVHLFRK